MKYKNGVRQGMDLSTYRKMRKIVSFHGKAER